MTDEIDENEAAFFQTCVELILEGNRVAKLADLDALQSCETRAKSLPQAARRIAGEWAPNFAKLTLADLSAGLCFLRAMQWKNAWRYARAEEAFAEAARHMVAFNELLDPTLALMPALPDLDQIAPLLRASVDVKAALLPLVQVHGRHCDAEKRMLLQAGLPQYLNSLLEVAGESRRVGDALLASAGELSDIRAIGVALGILAEDLRARVDSVEPLLAQLPKYQPLTGDKVFIIHGHAEDKWRELRELLHDRFGLRGRVVVLKEEVNQGQTVIEKFEARANECAFAFALLTPDDAVKKKADKGGNYLQARPNVLFELGWFYGRFGPRRLCILKRGDTAVPSDLNGVISLDFVDSVEEKALRIGDELRMAGVIGAAPVSP